MAKRKRTGDDDMERIEKILKLEEGEDAFSGESPPSSVAGETDPIDADEIEASDGSCSHSSDSLSISEAETLKEILEELDQMLTEEVGANDANAPRLRTESEIIVSGSERSAIERAACDSDEDDSPLRVPKKNEEEASTSTLQPDAGNSDEGPKRILKRPKASDLKILPKDFKEKKFRENKTEQSTPSPNFGSDEDSENEGKPVAKTSQKWEEEVHERRPLKRPPKKSQ